jgi:predicted dehydrogenase
MDAVQISCLLQTFDKTPGGQIGEYVLDANDSATMQVRLANGALGTVGATRFATGHLNDLRLRLYGLTGGIEVRFEKGESHLRASTGDNIKDGTWVDVDCPPVPTVYQRFIAAIRKEGPAEPDFARGAALQVLLDKAEASAAQDGRLLAV